MCGGGGGGGGGGQGREGCFNAGPIGGGGTVKSVVKANAPTGDGCKQFYVKTNMIHSLKPSTMFRCELPATKQYILFLSLGSHEKIANIGY